MAQSRIRIGAGRLRGMALVRPSLKNTSGSGLIVPHLESMSSCRSLLPIDLGLAHQSQCFQKLLSLLHSLTRHCYNSLKEMPR